MNNGMQNDWIQKLSAPDGTGAENSVNKTAAWETLHARLQLAPRRKKTAWYRVAAILLLTGALSYLILSKEKAIPAAESMVIKQDKQPTAPVDGVAVEPIQTLPFTALKKNRVKGFEKNNGTMALKQPSPLPDTLSMPAMQPPVLQPAISPMAIVAAVPVSTKKILPVVHINELGLQEKVNARFATHRQHAFIQIPLLEQDAGPVQEPPAAVAGEELIKTKISLKN
jgi:hypothetical protein